MRSFAWVVGAASTACAASAAIAQEQRAVSVRVRAHSGTAALAGVPFYLTGRELSGQRTYGRTDDQGICETTFPMPPGESRMVLVIAPMLSAERTLTESAMAEFRAVVSRHRFPRQLQVEVSPEAGETEIQIEAQPAVTVHGRVVENGKPVHEGSIVHAGAIVPTQTKRDGTFAVAGVPGEVTSKVFIVVHDRVKVVDMRPPVSEGLGDIAIEPLDRNARIRLKLGLPPPTASVVGGATLVSEDGRTVMTCLIHRNGPMGGWAEDIDWLSLPAGTYYIAPQIFVADEEQVALIALLLAGKDLSDTKVPRITVARGKTAELSFVPSEASAAIEAARKELAK